MSQHSHIFSIAPMMDWTDRHDRFFLRLISRRARLYSEMVVADAVIHGKRSRLLGFDKAEHPLALQLGGADPDKLAEAARIGEDFGYDEINLNIGCPSNRVQAGQFGAALMAAPDQVARCVEAMQAAVSIPVTVKCRIGIDEADPEIMLGHFADHVMAAGCGVFIIHARKAWLKGLSPKQNRTVPALDYALVYRLKARHPDLTVVVNGGIETLEQADAHLGHVDGVMLGRAAYHDPYVLAQVDRRYFGEGHVPPTRYDIAQTMLAYMTEQIAAGVALHAMTRHMTGLYQGCPGARSWRRHLCSQAPKRPDDVRVVVEALQFVEPERVAYERVG